MRTVTCSWSLGRRYGYLQKTRDQRGADLRHRFNLIVQSVFKVRGFQVSEEELEVLVRNHPDVDEVCVLGVPDLHSGEVPVALVVLGDEAKERTEKDD